MIQENNPVAHSTIQQHLTAVLAAEIQQCEPGARLPSARTLMSRFGCHRVTIERVLETLQRCGMLVRIARKGAFAAARQVKIIYFLTPCPYEVYRFDTRPFEAASREARRLGIQLEPIWVSRTNHADEIDRQSLLRIPCCAPVIVYGGWYRNVFELLVQRNCEVAFLDTHLEWPRKIAALIGCWQRFPLSSRSAINAATAHLAAQGCRRPLLVHGLSHIGAPLWRWYLQALKHCGMRHDPRLAFFLNSDFDSMFHVNCFIDSVSHFDGVLSFGQRRAQSVGAALAGHPEYRKRHIPQVCIFCCDNCGTLRPDIPLFGDNDSACYAAAIRYLASGELSASGEPRRHDP